MNENSNHRVLLALIISVSIGMEWYGRRCGFLFTPDSIEYLNSAKSFQTHGKFISADGSYNSYWAPLFSILLSLADNPLSFLGYINFACKLAMGVLLYVIGNSFLESSFSKIVFLIASMLNVSLMMISVFLWSELLFLTLVLFNFYIAINVNRKYYLAGLIMTGFLLCLQRNSGLFYILGLCIGLFMDQPSLKNFGRLTAFFVLSSSGLWVWNIYNTYYLPADFIFYEHSYFEGFIPNILLFTEAFGTYAIPLRSKAILIMFSLATVCLIALKLNKQRRLILIITLIYTICFTVLGEVSVDDIERYLSVIMPLVFLLLIATVEIMTFGTKHWVRYGIVVLTVLWLCYTLTRSVKNVQVWSKSNCQTESSI